MKTANPREIDILFNQIKSIVAIHEKDANLTREKFNIFSILDIEHYEEGTHSKFISHLLNPEGHHGFGNKFLQFFLEVIFEEAIDFNINNKYFVEPEHVIGIKDKDCTRGGRIDILLTDESGNTIMIENKIYAKEQCNQLSRYRKAYPNGKLLYLTLKGKDSKQKSSEDIEYIRVSYRNEIIKWPEKCQEETSNFSVVRETIKQYKNLIKKLTHQNINSEMNNELITSILKDENSLNAYSSLVKLENDLKNQMVSIVVEKLKTALEEDYFNIQTSELKNGRGLLISFQNEDLKKNNLSIRLNFEAKDYSRLILGFYNLNNKEYNFFNGEYLKKFKEVFPKAKSTHLYPGYIDYQGYTIWNIDKLKEIYFDFDKFYNNLTIKVDRMLKILK